MKDIILNLASIDLINFCFANKIDPSGTYTVKNGRGFNYSLVRAKEGRALVTVSFYKHSVPTHHIHK